MLITLAVACVRMKAAPIRRMHANKSVTRLYSLLETQHNLCLCQGARGTLWRRSVSPF